MNNIKNNLLIGKDIKKVYEYLASKHLNLTNLTSIYSDESIINRYYSPPTNNIYDGRIKNKNTKNSIYLDIIYNKNVKNSSSKTNLLTNKNTYINKTIINNNNNFIINNNINHGKRKIIRNLNLNQKKIINFYFKI